MIVCIFRGESLSAVPNILIVAHPDPVVPYADHAEVSGTEDEDGKARILLVLGNF
jgi:hypothetical protein